MPLWNTKHGIEIWLKILGLASFCLWPDQWVKGLTAKSLLKLFTGALPRHSPTVVRIKMPGPSQGRDPLSIKRMVCYRSVEQVQNMIQHC